MDLRTSNAFLQEGMTIWFWLNQGPSVRPWVYTQTQPPWWSSPPIETQGVTLRLPTPGINALPAGGNPWFLAAAKLSPRGVGLVNP